MEQGKLTGYVVHNVSGELLIISFQEFGETYVVTNAQQRIIQCGIIAEDGFDRTHNLENLIL